MTARDDLRRAMSRASDAAMDVYTAIAEHRDDDDIGAAVATMRRAHDRAMAAYAAMRTPDAGDTP